MRNLIVILGILTAINITFAQDKISIMVKVEGMLNREGHLSLSVFNSQASYMEQPFKSLKFDLAAHEGNTFIIEGLPVGEYAIATHHDENNNDELDFGPMGPIEGYGFSNNPPAFYGPADYEASKFSVSSDTVMTITLN